jgi:carbonic anhydrase/acetyltransferase-like protein (isoleucine patch superfamily)
VEAKEESMNKIAVLLCVLVVGLVIGFGGNRLWIPSAALAQGPARAYPLPPAAGKPGITIDPTAFVHPSVILEGTINIGPYAYVDAGSILTGGITVGHHTLIRCNVTIRGSVKIGNYTHIYDNVNIEGGRPAKPVGGSLAEVADQAIIGDHCWINHGAIMHGTQIADGGAVGLGAVCDYNTHIGKNAVLADGSATRVNMEICDGCFFEGVPAVRRRKGLTEKDRAEYFGVSPLAWTLFEGDRQEANAKKRLSQ